MAEELRRIIPTPTPQAADIFTTHQLGHEFRQEVEYRENFKQYCDWYHFTAELNQRELHKMRSDINVFGWFNRGKK